MALKSIQKLGWMDALKVATEPLNRWLTPTGHQPSRLMARGGRHGIYADGNTGWREGVSGPRWVNAEAHLLPQRPASAGWLLPQVSSCYVLSSGPVALGQTHDDSDT